MPYIDPGWSNGGEPPINDTNLRNISAALTYLFDNVLFIAEQTLTTAQQNQLKENLAALSYTAQTLTTQQQSQARANIAALSFDSQSLTATQKSQARANIGAAPTPTYSGAVNAPTTLTVADNSIYVLQSVSACTITYPVGNFICTIRFTTAAQGTVSSALIFPAGTKYIGVIPPYANSTSYECSIMSAGGLAVATIATIGAGT